MSDQTSRHTNGQPSLAQTRRELVEFLSHDNGGEAANKGSGARGAEQARANRATDADAKADREAGFSWRSYAETGLASWWHDHPARAGAVLLRTAVEETARRKPLPTIAVAAAAGAALVFIKPWRLVSTTAVMMTLFRSSNFTGVVTSLLEKAAQSLQKE